MSIYRLSVSTVSRSAGRSAVAAAAYRAGERLTDERADRVADYTRRREIRHTEIVGWAGERGALWNSAERAERRKDSVVAREVQLALPTELRDEQRTALAVGFAHWLHERYGVAVDVAVHGPGRKGDWRNHHAHLLLTTRAVDAAGAFGAKTRVLDVARTSAAEVEQMRAAWSDRVNDALAAAGVGAQVDHRSYVRQGVRRESENLARAAVALEQRGTFTDQGTERSRRRARNAAAAAAGRTRARVRYEAHPDVEQLEAAIGGAARRAARAEAAVLPTSSARMTAAGGPDDVLAGIRSRRIGPTSPTPAPTPTPPRPSKPLGAAE